MKKISLLLVIIVMIFADTVQSQDTLRLFGNRKTKVRTEHQKTYRYNDNGIQTLTGPGRKIGFYFGINSGYTRIDGYDAFSAGANIALIANHGLAIGFAGKGFFSEPYKTSNNSDLSYNYAGGYGGILIEPILFPKFPIHIAFPVLLGVGGVTRSRWTNFYDPYNYHDVWVGNAEAYLIVEPGVQIEVNVARWMRLAMGGSYRFTTSLEPVNFKTDLLNGFTGELSLKFGMF